MKIAKKSFFKKLLPVAVVGAGLAVAGTAMASWSDVGRVTSIQQSRGSYDDGKTVITLEGVSCDSGRFYIANSSSNKDVQINLLTASLLAGKPVALAYSAKTDGCDVYLVKLIAN